jgi:uncharacterized protein YfeS
MKSTIYFFSLDRIHANSILISFQLIKLIRFSSLTRNALETLSRFKLQDVIKNWEIKKSKPYINQLKNERRHAKSSPIVEQHLRRIEQQSHKKQ